MARGWIARYEAFVDTHQLAEMLQHTNPVRVFALHDMHMVCARVLHSACTNIRTHVLLSMHVMCVLLHSPFSLDVGCFSVIRPFVFFDEQDGACVRVAAVCVDVSIDV